MNLFIFASFLIFGFWLTYQLSKSRKLNKKTNDDFWENENMANSVRKKQIEDSDLVSFPFNKLPSPDTFEESSVPESLMILLSLSDEKMINLNGISNTEVKKRFGAANLNLLTVYDTNYENFVKHIYLLCQHLYDIGRMEEATLLSEEAILTGSDSLSHYKLLIQIYRKQKNFSGIDWLKERANLLHSLTKGAILRALSEDDFEETAP